jgi:hypothetical protein
MRTREETKNAWVTMLMERTLKQGHRALLCVLAKDTWEWSIEDGKGTTRTFGIKFSRHQAMVACHREAARLQLLDSGSGLGSRR